MLFWYKTLFLLPVRLLINYLSELNPSRASRMGTLTPSWRGYQLMVCAVKQFLTSTPHFQWLKVLPERPTVYLMTRLHSSMLQFKACARAFKCQLISFKNIFWLFFRIKSTRRFWTASPRSTRPTRRHHLRLLRLPSRPRALQTVQTGSDVLIVASQGTSSEGRSGDATPPIPSLLVVVRTSSYWCIRENNKGFMQI